MRLLQHLRQLALLALQIRIPANMLLGDEDVGHGALVRHLLERVLDRCTVVWVVIGLSVIGSELTGLEGGEDAPTWSNSMM